jgi:hypothetical protein
MVLGRFRISIYRNLSDYFISSDIDLKETAAGIGDRLDIGLVLEGFFRGLPRGLRSGKVFSVVRILRSIMPPF